MTRLPPPTKCVDLFGDASTVCVQRAEHKGEELLDLMLDLDLQMFAEPSYPRPTLSALVRFGEVFVLKQADELWGAAVVLRHMRRPQAAVMLSIGIHPGWRGAGLGRFFIESIAMQLANEQDFDELVLEVAEDNWRANKLYASMGFVGLGSQNGKRSWSLDLSRWMRPDDGADGDAPVLRELSAS